MTDHMQEELFAFISRHMTLTDEEKGAIADLDLFRKFPKGTVLLKAGETSDEGYFVMQGCLRTYYVIGGEEKTTAFFTESETLAPPCVATGGPSELFVACVEDSIIAVSNQRMEREMFERFPRFESLCRILSERLLAKSQASLDAFKTSTPEQRYLHLLDHRPDLLQRVPLHQLASFIGVTPESLSRIRKRIAMQPRD